MGLGFWGERARRRSEGLGLERVKVGGERGRRTRREEGERMRELGGGGGERDSPWEVVEMRGWRREGCR